jgi:hypothetical protein
MTSNGKPVSNLKSNNPAIVLGAIEGIRATGTGAQFAELLELLHETNSLDIKKQILRLFSELKSSDTIPLMIDALQKKRYAGELKELLTCCWQNGLNYSPWMPFFVDLVINEEFFVSFEAFTVIENMYGKIADDILTRQVIKINKALENADGQKRYLLNELKPIIQNLPERNRYNG